MLHNLHVIKKKLKQQYLQDINLKLFYKNQLNEQSN
jgi:hypothetical protein